MDPKRKARLEALGISVQPITPELAAKWGILMSPGQRRGQSRPPAPEGQSGPATPSDKSKNEKDGKAAADGNQVEEGKTSKHITIREATEDDYRKLQHWNVGTFYRVTQSDAKENMPGFKIGPKSRGKEKSSTPETSADDPIYTGVFAVEEMCSRPFPKAAEEEASQQAQQPRASQGSSQNVKPGSGKVKRSKE